MNAATAMSKVDARAIRDLLNQVDIEDPHAFATAYVEHVEAFGDRPPLAVAALRWVRSGLI